MPLHRKNRGGEHGLSTDRQWRLDAIMDTSRCGPKHVAEHLDRERIGWRKLAHQRVGRLGRYFLSLVDNLAYSLSAVRR
jgi:hypothetical protein